MQNKNLVGTTEALNITEQIFRRVTLPTMISWCQRYKLGLKIGGQWFVDEKRLKEFLETGSTEWLKDDEGEKQKKDQSQSNSKSQQIK